MKSIEFAKPKFKSKIEEQHYIAGLNSKVPFDTWIKLLEEWAVSLQSKKFLVESIDRTILSDIKNLESFSSNNIETGKQYIPIMIMVAGSSVQIFDINQEFPAKMPAEFCTLVSKKENNFEFLVRDKKLKFPLPLLSNLSYITTILIDNENNYEKFRTSLALMLGIILPDLA